LRLAKKELLRGETSHLRLRPVTNLGTYLFAGAVLSGAGSSGIYFNMLHRPDKQAVLKQQLHLPA